MTGREVAIEGGIKVPEREKRRVDIDRVVGAVDVDDNDDGDDELTGRVQERAGFEEGGGWSGKYRRWRVRGEGGSSVGFGGEGGGDGGGAKETVFLRAVDS